MFAHVPNTHHITRTYNVQQGAHPTTSRKLKGGDKENAGVIPNLASKTPSRTGPSNGGGLWPATAGKALGLKTVERNVLAPKGKRVDGDEIEPKRLFQASGSKGSIPPSKSLTSMPSILPRGANKTPGINRTNPPPSAQRSNLHLRTPAPSRVAPAPSPAPLPSAQRTRRRSRNSLTSTQNPGSTGPDFHTPIARWEEEHSLESIGEVEGEGPILDIGELANVAEEVCEGEDEFALPTAEDKPWEPSWSAPDVTAIMAAITSVPPLWMPPSELELGSEMFSDDLDSLYFELWDDNCADSSSTVRQSKQSGSNNFARQTISSKMQSRPRLAPSNSSKQMSKTSSTLKTVPKTVPRSTVASTSQTSRPVLTHRLAKQDARIGNGIKATVPTSRPTAAQKTSAAAKRITTSSKTAVASRMPMPSNESTVSKIVGVKKPGISMADLPTQSNEDDQLLDLDLDDMRITI